MSVPPSWGTPEDFATLFQYVWHRDFPMGPGALGARRVDWTIHIGVAVRTIADLMGFVTRFERGGRKDAILRSANGDEIAIEWEWDGVAGNELQKLREHDVWSFPNVAAENPDRLLRYAVLISYVRQSNIQKRRDEISCKWQGARWPLLLILVDIERRSRKYRSGREFGSLNMFLFDRAGVPQSLRKAPAYPWAIEQSRWAAQNV